MRSHLISQVVLKRFADSSNQIAVTDKRTGNVEFVKPYDAAYTELDDALISTLEQRWSSDVENHAQKALNTLYDGGVLHTTKHQLIIKKLLAIHYVRSSALLVLLERGKVHYANQIIESMVADYPDREDLIRKTVAEEWPLKIVETLPLVLDENIDKVEKFIMQHDLEIGLAAEGSRFVIGDIPAVTANEKGMGVLAGVPITESTSFAMPLTPHHLVTLKTRAKTKKYIQLTAKQVENANTKLIAGSLEVYFSQPQGTISAQ